MATDTLQELFVAQLKDIYDAQNRVLATLPQLIRSTQNDDLQQVLAVHEAETKWQINRLREIASMDDISIEGETCDATQGIIFEADKQMRRANDPDVMDATIIIYMQRIEHYAISTYSSIILITKQLDADANSIVQLEQTLVQKKQMDFLLSQIATEGLLAESVNKAARK